MSIENIETANPFVLGNSETVLSLKDGTQIAFGHAKQSDLDQIGCLYEGLSEIARERRFLEVKSAYQAGKEGREQTSVVHPEYVDDIVARTDGGIIVGMAVILLKYGCKWNSDDKAAEVAYVVDEKYAGQRIGSSLIKRSFERADELGIKMLIAAVDIYNAPMVSGFERVVDDHIAGLDRSRLKLKSESGATEFQFKLGRQTYHRRQNGKKLAA